MEKNEYRTVSIDGVEFKLGPDEQIESLEEFDGCKGSPNKEKED